MAECSALRAGCLVMAAGNASRFGENKLAARFDGQSLFSLALAAIPAEMFARVTVVSQYPALLEEASLAGFDTILNDRPEDGISRTIRLGTQAMADCAGIYIWSPTNRCCGPGRCGASWTRGGRTRTALPLRRTTESAATRACSRRGSSRSCAHWRLTAAARPSSGGTRMRCCSSRQGSASCSTATQSRRWRS